jgi:hypothetical protein
MTAPNGLFLAPGCYLIEVATGRSGATADVIRRGLEAAGFDSVVADEPGVVPVPPAVGAAMTMGPKASSAIGPSPPSPSLSNAALRATGTPKLAAQAAQILAGPDLSQNSPARGILRPQGLAATARPSAAATGLPTLAKQVAAIRQAAAASAPAHHSIFGDASAAPGGGGGGGGGGDGGDGSGGAEPNFVADPDDPHFATDTSTGDEYYVDDQGAIWGVDKSNALVPLDQTTLKPNGAPSPGQAPPKGLGVSTPAGTTSFADDLAGPLGADPAFSISIGGVLFKPGEDTFRFVAHTPSDVVLRPGLGISWGARRVAVDPYADIAVRSRPFPLFHGVTYDMVLLGRDRRAKSRGDVWTLAEAMGFDPQAISLLRRDVHLPGRPNASYSRWVLVGTWMGPDTVTTAEEPLFFEQVEAGAAP